MGPIPLRIQILPGQGRPPSTSLGVRKLDTGLLDGEDNIPLRSLVLTQYRSVTDRQTDGFAVAYTALCRAVKTEFVKASFCYVT